MFRRFGRSSVATSLLIVGAFLASTAITASAASAKEQLTRLSDKDFQHVEKLASQGDAGAAALLGVAYEEGAKVPQDLAVAIKWYRQAAVQGDPKVQHHLATMYEQGRGVMAD